MTRHPTRLLIRACAATLFLVMLAASCSGDDETESGDETGGE